MSSTKADLDDLKAWISRLPRVSSGPHRFGGVEFRVDGLEFMHFHGPTHLDIRLSKTDQTQVLAAGKAERHLYAPEAGWVTLRIKSGEDIDEAKEVIQLAYNNASSVLNEHQIRQIPAVGVSAEAFREELRKGRAEDRQTEKRLGRRHS